LRFGSPAITTRGFRESETETVANLVADVLEAPTGAGVLARVGERVHQLCEAFPVYATARS
jgi:glycine hydroxymethyltransferase